MELTMENSLAISQKAKFKLKAKARLKLTQKFLS